ncbi:MAG: tetratricopeptide repeat protein [Nitrospinae bacterium]|nr:tetratricopeptide repeat protein [Nitrospinota bacterium]
MSLKLIAVFLLFALLSVYIAFLNPQDVHLRLTQSLSLQVPAIVLILGSVAAGIAIAAAANGIFLIRELPKRARSALQAGRRERLRTRLGKTLEQAENALAAGRGPKAAPLFQKILDLEPGHLPSLCRLGVLMRKEGKFREALELHGKASRLSPGNIRILSELAEDYAASGQNDREVDVLNSVLELDRNSLETLGKLRDAWLKIPDWDRAYGAQRAILRLTKPPELEKEQDRFAEIIHANAMRHYKNGAVEMAKIEFKRAIRENGRSLPAYISLGDIYSRENLWKEAAKTWKTAYHNTQSPVCLQRLQKFHETSPAGFKDLVKLYEEAVRSSKNASKTRLAIMLASLLMEKGENDKAARTLETLPGDAPLAGHILLATARQARDGNGYLPDVSRSIVNKTRQAVFQFACGDCRAPAKEWAAHCPSCGAWNRVTWGPV